MEKMATPSSSITMITVTQTSNKDAQEVPAHFSDLGQSARGVTYQVEQRARGFKLSFHRKPHVLRHPTKLSDSLK
jgi:hypothetical protein